MKWIGKGRLLAAVMLIAMIGSILPQTAVAAPLAASCTNVASFVSDVTIPDNARIDAGKAFDKTWRLRNSGTCTWSTSYVIYFSKGTQLGAPASVHLPKSVSPGSTVDVTVPMKAPSSAGTYRGDWKLKDGSGNSFGLGTANATFWVVVVVPTSSSSSGGTPTTGGSWKGEYFRNGELRGVPYLVRTDKAVDFDWKKNSPANGIPADRFSVRWTSKPTFDKGTYRFRLVADTGARLYVDGKLVLDAWRDGKLATWWVDVDLSKGSHAIRLDYREVTGDAHVKLTWEAVKKVTITDWKGEYFANTGLQGSPALVRNDKTIQFSWGWGSPASYLPKSAFSARWTRTIDFPAGTYRFSAKANSGVRVSVDGSVIIDAWQSGADVLHTADITLTGPHKIIVTFVERGGKANINFAYAKLSSPTEVPSPTAEPTATSEPTATAEPTTEATAAP